MSRDIFAENFAGSHLTRAQYGFAGLIDGAQAGHSSNRAPRDPDMQRIADEINAERDAERARKEVEMDTPENRQKASEAKVAERERKIINFHCSRALPMYMDEGWKHIQEEMADEEVRVYTIGYKRRRFWGIKPAGMGMWAFWEQNDPEIDRYDDHNAVTWANPLISPPVTAWDEMYPVIWAGRGLDPTETPPEPHVAEAPSPAKAAAKSRRHQKTPDINATHRVKKPTAKSPKANKNTRKSLADKLDSGHKGLEDQVRDTAEKIHADERSTRSKAAPQIPDTQQKSATEDEYSATSKRPRGRPAIKEKPVANDEISTPKRPRGRPAASTRKTTNNQDKVTPKRPRGRPPATGKPSKQKKTPAVKGKTRVTKSSQANTRPSAPSTHKMRTRREGSAELLQLP